MHLIQAENITKVYRTNVKQPGVRGALRNLMHAQWQDKVAIDAVSFTMAEGTALACIGENGAGKSTLIKMLVGILRPTSGSVRVYDQDPMAHHSEYLRKIGVVFGQKTNLWWDIPVIESYRAVQTLYRLDKSVFQQTMDAIIERLQLAPILQSPARKLSLGQRMKADIGMVFLHRPRILYLDEPTIGLDINVKHTIRQFIRETQREQGVSVLLTSHDLDDIDQICEDALVLSQGKVFFQGSLQTLKRQYASGKVILVTGEALCDPAQVLHGAKITTEGRRARIVFDAAVEASADLLQRISQCYAIEDITIQEPDIDDVVSKIFAQGGQT